MKQRCVFICFLAATCLFAQDIDVAWFDSDWRPTTKNEQAAFFRICNLDTINNLYLIQDHYSTGELYRTGTLTSLNPEVRDGMFIWYYKNGKKQKEIVYSDNEVKDWKVLNERGKPQLSVVVNFQGPNGEILSEARKVDKEPEYVGGKKAMNVFLRKNLVYPPVTAMDPIDGTVLVLFQINEEGKPIDARVVKSIHPELDKEALRVVSIMPAWHPGRVNGQAVTVPFVLPVKFQNKSSQSYSRNNATRDKGNFSY
jgi:TonB family protein